MPRKRFKKQKQESNYTCYECGNQGHIKHYYPLLLIKLMFEEKKKAKKYTIGKTEITHCLLPTNLYL